MSISDLTEKLDVSPATVRRDLARLEHQGLIHRIRGGATLTDGLGIEPSWTERTQEHISQKRAIARLANELIKDNQVIALDVGTTTLELARLLAMRSDLMVFTASMPISELLARGRAVVYMVGGRLRSREMAVVGPLTREIISRFHYDIFFMAAAGWSLEQGLMDFSVEDVEIKQAFIEASNQVVACVDSSKYGKNSLMTISKIRDIDIVITDERLPNETRDQIGEVTDLRLASVDATERGLG